MNGVLKIEGICCGKDNPARRITFEGTHANGLHVGKIIKDLNRDAGLTGIGITIVIPEKPVFSDEGQKYIYGWLKDYPTYEGEGLIVSQRYEFGLWAEDIYGAHADAEEKK